MGRPDGDRQFPSKAIRVDLGNLSEFAQVVRAENQRTLLPQSDAVLAGLMSGVPFGGASASGYVYAAKERYRQSLIRATEQLSAYVRAAEILADAADYVARQYAETDAMAAARTADVQAALTAAVVTAERTAGRTTSRGL